MSCHEELAVGGDTDDFDDEFTELRYVAIYPYSAREEGDLTLCVGDIVQVYEMQEDGWARGRVSDQEGYFPSNYVQFLPPEYLIADDGKQRSRNGVLKMFASKFSYDNDGAADKPKAAKKPRKSAGGTLKNFFRSVPGRIHLVPASDPTTPDGEDSSAILSDKVAKLMSKTNKKSERSKKPSAQNIAQMLEEAMINRRAGGSMDQINKIDGHDELETTTDETYENLSFFVGDPSWDPDHSECSKPKRAVEERRSDFVSEKSKRHSIGDPLSLSPEKVETNVQPIDQRSVHVTGSSPVDRHQLRDIQTRKGSLYGNIEEPSAKPPCLPKPRGLRKTPPILRKTPQLVDFNSSPRISSTIRPGVGKDENHNDKTNKLRLFSEQQSSHPANGTAKQTISAKPGGFRRTSSTPSDLNQLGLSTVDLSSPTGDKPRIALKPALKKTTPTVAGDLMVGATIISPEKPKPIKAKPILKNSAVPNGNISDNIRENGNVASPTEGRTFGETKSILKPDSSGLSLINIENSSSSKLNDKPKVTATVQPMPRLAVAIDCDDGEIATPSQQNQSVNNTDITAVRGEALSLASPRSPGSKMASNSNSRKQSNNNQDEDSRTREDGHPKSDKVYILKPGNSMMQPEESFT